MRDASREYGSSDSGSTFDRALDGARMGTNDDLVVPDSVAANAL